MIKGVGGLDIGLRLNIMDRFLFIFLSIAIISFVIAAFSQFSSLFYILSGISVIIVILGCLPAYAYYLWVRRVQRLYGLSYDEASKMTDEYLKKTLRIKK